MTLIIRAPQSYNLTIHKIRKAQHRIPISTQVLKICIGAKIPGVLPKSPGNQFLNTKMLKMDKC